MNLLPKAALYLLTVCVLALYLPRLYDALMFERVEKTHLFYSPEIR